MRILSVLILACCTAIAVGADEIQPPKTAQGPMHALASAKIDGKRISITIRVPDVVCEVREQEITTLQDVKKTVNGKEVIEKVPVKAKILVQHCTVKGLREVKVIGKDIKVVDVAGKVVPIGQLTKLLAQETPVFLNLSPDPVDPFHLATVKGGTLIISIDPNKVFPPQPPIAPPVAPPPPKPSSPAFARWLVDNKCSFDAEDIESRSPTYNIKTVAEIPAKPFAIFWVHMTDATDAKMKALADFAIADPALRGLFFSVNNGKFTAAAIREMSRIKSLGDINGGFGAPGIRGADLAPLAEMPHLTRMGIGDTTTGDELMDGVRRCVRLTSLYLNNCDISPAGVKKVAELKNLEELYINSSKLNSEVWDDISKLSHLKTLRLVLCPDLGGAGLAKIKSLPLVALDLRAAGIKDDDMKHIAAIGSLKELRLEGNAITNAGLKQIEKLPLTYLLVKKTKVTAMGLKQFAAAQPMCKIESDLGK